MKQVTFLVKPASSLCDLRCQYCFYRDISDIREVKSMGIMSENTADALISAAFDAVKPDGVVQFTFQGGEPTLAGLEFFRKFMELEAQQHSPKITVSHAIQTNAVHLDEEWACFLKENGFLVGVSIDGNQAIHDTYRVDAAGNGTWERVTKALVILDQHGVETNILCVITSAVAKNPQRVYASLRRLGNHPIQFIPCLDPLEAHRGQKKYSLKPEAYGHFLCGLFDCWYRDWNEGNYVSIRTFDDFLRILMHYPPSTCAASGTCGSYLVAEGDGSLYPCDFYALDEWRIGNIREMSVAEALVAPASVRFIHEGFQRPENCRTCTYFPICRGGCKRDWTLQGKNYYCTSYKVFFDYALPRLKKIALLTMRR